MKKRVFNLAIVLVFGLYLNGCDSSDTTAISKKITIDETKKTVYDTTAISKRFTIDEIKKTAYDTTTKIMWQNPSGTHTSGKNAEKYCSELILAGYDDWSLPTQAQSKVFHIQMNKQGDTPKQNFSSCTAEYTLDGYVKTKKGATKYNGAAGDSINFSGSANVRCIRDSNDDENEKVNSTTSCNTGTKQEKSVCEHNKVRAKHFTEHTLVVDTELIDLSDLWAKSLTNNNEFKHDPDNKTNKTGENLYVTSSSDEPTYKDAIEAWESEESDYNYENNSCADSKVCGHYTQLVWKNTSKVGCAKSQYSDDPKWENGWVIVCKYKTPGNYTGEKPY